MFKINTTTITFIFQNNLFFIEQTSSSEVELEINFFFFNYLFAFFNIFLLFPLGTK